MRPEQRSLHHEERARDTGYLWWATHDGGHSSFFAGGFGGQYITVIPDLHLVVVTTGDVDVFTETLRNLRRLVAEVVIPEITA
jgi:CubicO group peptidase (beta-lactamase class C family)